MRNLIEFIKKNNYWFLFILLELICFYFIFTRNSYQKSVFLNSSNEIVGGIYAASGSITSYFGLKGQNEDLLQQNIELEKEVLALKEYIFSVETDTVKFERFLKNIANNKAEYDLIAARVINNSVSKINNFITINKGENDGVKMDMGVASQRGVVGVVAAVSANRAIVLPILNPSTRIGCKVLNSNAYGILMWEGDDPRYAYLKDYPKYEAFEKGDTIVTSGFSQMFPEGIMVGIVEDAKSQANDNFYSLKVRLSTDFTTLKDVILINDFMLEEQRALENKVNNAKR